VGSSPTYILDPSSGNNDSGAGGAIQANITLRGELLFISTRLGEQHPKSSDTNKLTVENRITNVAVFSGLSAAQIVFRVNRWLELEVSPLRSERLLNAWLRHSGAHREERDVDWPSGVPSARWTGED
jgi:hypothetical protein